MKVVAQVVLVVVATVAAALAVPDPDGSYHLDSRGVHHQLGLTPPRQLLETHHAAKHARTHGAEAAGVYSAGVEQQRDPDRHYAWAYEVAAPSSGDRKAAREERRGDLVVGQYSVVDPDGSLRVVDYFVKPETGFRVTINKDEEALTRQTAFQYTDAGQPPHRTEEASADSFRDPQLRSQRPEVAQGVIKTPQISPQGTDPFKSPDFRSQDIFKAPQTPLQITDHFESSQIRSQRPEAAQDVFKAPHTTPQVTDHFRTPQLRDQIQRGQKKDQFKSPQFQVSQLQDQVQTPQVTDHFKIPQFKKQVQRPQATRDPTQTPQFRHLPQSPIAPDHLTRPQFKEFADIFQSPQFGRDRFQSPQPGQPFQPLQPQIIGQPVTEFRFQHPHFSKHHILSVQPQPFFDIPHFPGTFFTQVSPQTTQPFQMHQLPTMQQATGSPFSHPTFSKHRFLRPGQLRSDSTQVDQLPGQLTDKVRFQQAQQEKLKIQQAHASTPQGQQNKADRLHLQAQGISDQFRSQDFSRDQGQTQRFSEGVFQNPQSRFQQLSSVPGSGITLKAARDNLESQRPTQSIGRPSHLATTALIQDRARGIPPVQTRPATRPDHSPFGVVSTVN